jgi:uncharacterized protein (DUF1778 family)
MISVPDELLERIDRAAGVRGTSRSAFLQEAARRARAALAGAGCFESAALIRADRETHDARDRRRL